MRDRVVGLLREMADAMRIAGDRPRARAYGLAASNIEKREDFDALCANGRLQRIPGVGPNIEQRIVAFIEQGERPPWLDDPSNAPLRRRGRVSTLPSARDAEAYFEAPFADAPDLHVHTTWSDGVLTLEEVVVMAKHLGAPAIGISDHSGSLRIANGLPPDAVRDQWVAIDALQEAHPDILILRGTECDIKRDGSLDHPDDLLPGFDYVIGSLHGQLKLDKRAQTERVLAALDNEHLTLLGHPTTRVPGRRVAAALDLPKIFQKAAEKGVALEVNGNPGRLDLDVPLAREALAAGCRLACGSDAHTAPEMLAFATARQMAREAGATEGDLVNYDVARARMRAREGRALTSP